MSANFGPETLTPELKDENKLKENESYTCTKCSSLIEIISLDDINNIISFKCPSHGTNTMTIKEYLDDMKKNTFLYSACSSCKKKQNEINNNEIFKYCTNCKIIICNNCIINHDKEHYIINNNKNLTVCPLHPKNNNLSYCLDCNCHICKECMKHRKHMEHKKKIIQEIEPSDDEINSLLKIINTYKKEINSFENEKNNQLVDIKNKFNKDEKKEKDDYDILKNKTQKDLENELSESENNYKDELNEIKKKYEKELDERANIFENNKKSINNKYEKIKCSNKESFDKKCEILKIKSENEKKRIENEFKEKINNFKELLKINDIIYNTYITSKENYFHNINIINLLVNYYKKKNSIIKEMENNEDFMETVKQREFELSKIQIENSNPRKIHSFIEEKKFIKCISLKENNNNRNTMKNIKPKKLNSIDKRDIPIIYDNKTLNNVKSIKNINDIKSVEERINSNIFKEKNHNKSQNDLINLKNNDINPKD